VTPDPGLAKATVVSPTTSTTAASTMAVIPTRRGFVCMFFPLPYLDTGQSRMTPQISDHRAHSLKQKSTDHQLSSSVEQELRNAGPLERELVKLRELVERLEARADARKQIEGPRLTLIRREDVGRQ
jgi:hypothetical protein